MIVTSGLIAKLKELVRARAANKEVAASKESTGPVDPELVLPEPTAVTASAAETEPTAQEFESGLRQEASALAKSEQVLLAEGESSKKRTFAPWGVVFKRRPGIGKAVGKTVGTPIRLIIGYFPGITEREAKEYARGLAQKHCDQLSISYTGAFKHANGYAFEIQEGGSGKAFTPEVLKHFDSLGPYTAGENNYVVLKTATRLVEVVRLQDGLGTVILPEGAKKDVTEWLQPSKSLKNVQPSQAKFFYATSLLFASGVIACVLSGTVFRLQPYSTEAGVKKEVVSASKLPRSQWAVLSATPRGFYVKTLRFSEGRWLPPELAAEEPSTPPVKSLPELEKK